jgi:hypothetical protein
MSPRGRRAAQSGICPLAEEDPTALRSCGHTATPRWDGMPAFRRSSTLVHDDGFDALLTKGDLQQLAELRLMDAVLLHENARYSSAYYLSGYAVELALKACIARQIVQNMIPDRGFVNAMEFFNG